MPQRPQGSSSKNLGDPDNERFEPGKNDKLCDNKRHLLCIKAIMTRPGRNTKRAG